MFSILDAGLNHSADFWSFHIHTNIFNIHHIVIVSLYIELDLYSVFMFGARCRTMLISGDFSPHLNDTVNMNSRLDPTVTDWMKVYMPTYILIYTQTLKHMHIHIKQLWLRSVRPKTYKWVFVASSGMIHTDG